MHAYSQEADLDITLRQLDRMRGMQYAARDWKRVKAELEHTLLDKDAPDAGLQA